MVEWDKDGRKALFFHLAFVPVYFPIFQDFDLTDLHLRVDYKLMDTDNVPHRKLPPHYVSLIYVNSKIEEKSRCESSIPNAVILSMQNYSISMIHWNIRH